MLLPDSQVNILLMIFNDRWVLPVRMEPSNESRVAAVEAVDVVDVVKAGELLSLLVLSFTGDDDNKGDSLAEESRRRARGNAERLLELFVLLLLSYALSASATESIVEERVRTACIRVIAALEKAIPGGSGLPALSARSARSAPTARRPAITSADSAGMSANGPSPSAM
jgi:hypothetical protein